MDVPRSKKIPQVHHHVPRQRLLTQVLLTIEGLVKERGLVSLHYTGRVKRATTSLRARRALR